MHRILTAVEKDRRNHWVEITCAVVLSLATMSSAWCAYQSTRWSGVQTFRLAAVNKASRASSAANLAALQLQAFDASMGISWMQAKHEGNDLQEKFLFDRFRPEMKKAVEAWLKTDPFSNPTAPLGPMKMTEYAQPELAEAKRQDELSSREYDAAMQANQTSDAYVLLTVLFASVLFFGGIAGTLESRRLRIIILAIALVLFVVTVAFLGTMPICQE
ncbi:MAG: hypothetical protein JSS49_20990 [Planctomycetes bacterium]|nr:hypothetical protein [Planctomycetota bacterium]